jgi:hypothetical protein
MLHPHSLSHGEADSESDSERLVKYLPESESGTIIRVRVGRPMDAGLRMCS